jgi:hypothetical protein
MPPRDAPATNGRFLHQDRASNVAIAPNRHSRQAKHRAGIQFQEWSVVLDSRSTRYRAGGNDGGDASNDGVIPAKRSAERESGTKG